MRIIVTAGGTTEAIDGVRGITNFSSGALGRELAVNLSVGFDHDVFFLHGKRTAPAPACQNMEITDTASLQAALDQIREDHPRIDVIVHAMAVSDYTVAAALDLDAVLNELRALPTITVADIEAAFGTERPKEGKMSSTVKRPVLVLKQTPKVIQGLRDMWPYATLIGFKLLNGVLEEDLVQVAQAAMEKTRADYVVANDLANIQADRHRALILSATQETPVSVTETKGDLVWALSRLVHRIAA